MISCLFKSIQDLPVTSAWSSALTVHCSIMRADRTMTLPISPSRIIKWFTQNQACGLVECEFPELDPDQREFLLTGMLPRDWDELFPPEPES